MQKIILIVKLLKYLKLQYLLQKYSVLWLHNTQP